MKYIILLVCLLLIFLYYNESINTFENVNHYDSVSIMILYNLDNKYNLPINTKQNIKIMDTINIAHINNTTMIYKYSDFIDCPYHQLKVMRERIITNNCYDKETNTYYHPIRCRQRLYNIMNKTDSYLIIGPTNWFKNNNLEDKILITLYLREIM